MKVNKIVLMLFFFINIQKNQSTPSRSKILKESQVVFYTVIGGIDDKEIFENPGKK